MHLRGAVLGQAGPEVHRLRSIASPAGRYKSTGTVGLPRRFVIVLVDGALKSELNYYDS